MNMELAERYIPLAESMACRRSRSLPSDVTFDDVKSAAYFALAEAANRYDPGRGVSFPAYAKLRISGEITDLFRRRPGECTEPPDMEAPSGHDVVETRDFFDFVESELGYEDAEMVRGYYIDGRSLKEVGAARGFGESRACQILKSCHERLRGSFEREEFK